jgi:hypothetical protein
MQHILGVDDPETLRALQEVFDVTWSEINSTPDNTPTGDRAGDGSGNRRNDLAQMIILAHQSGLRPEEIRTAILGEITASRIKYGGKSDTAFMSRTKVALTNRGQGDGKVDEDIDR